MAVRLVLLDQEVEIIRKALEMYYRMGMGQWEIALLEYFAEHMRQMSSSPDAYDRLKQIIAQSKHELFGLQPHEALGIGNPLVSEACRMAQLTKYNLTKAAAIGDCYDYAGVVATMGASILGCYAYAGSNVTTVPSILIDNHSRHSLALVEQLRINLARIGVNVAIDPMITPFVGFDDQNKKWCIYLASSVETTSIFKSYQSWLNWISIESFLHETGATDFNKKVLNYFNCE